MYRSRLRQRVARTAALGLLLGLGASHSHNAQSVVDVLVSRAITFAGGEPRLREVHALTWHGTAAVHVAGRDIALGGFWQVQPPDTAVVTTWEASKGPEATRRLILTGSTLWTQRNGKLEPLPAEMLADEQHQFYLYSLVRALPLRDPRTRLEVAANDSEGHAGLYVRHEGRPDVTLHFDADGRVCRVTSQVTDQAGKRITQVMLLSGTMESGGVRWFRQLRITRDGQPYFELELTDLQALKRLNDPLLPAPR
jgi:hypothetical protein